MKKVTDGVHQNIFQESISTHSDLLSNNTLYNGNYIGNFPGGKAFGIGKNKQDSIGLNTRLLVKGANRMAPVLSEELK